MYKMMAIVIFCVLFTVKKIVSKHLNGLRMDNSKAKEMNQP